MIIRSLIGVSLFCAVIYAMCNPIYAQLNAPNMKLQVETDFNKGFFAPSTTKDIILDTNKPPKAGRTIIRKATKKSNVRYQEPTAFNIRNVDGLKEACRHVVLAEKQEPFDATGYGVCLGYIKGVKNSYDITQKHVGAGNICFPKTVTWLQLISAFISWEKNEKNAERMLAWTGLINAFAKYYPCQPELLE